VRVSRRVLVGFLANDLVDTFFREDVDLASASGYEKTFALREPRFRDQREAVAAAPLPSC
jgi:hypothetical protein